MNIIRRVVLVVLCATYTTLAFAQTAPTANQQITAVLEQIKKRAALKFSATTVQNTIDAADFQAKRISTVTIAASIDETAANALIGEQLKADKTFKNAKFKFAGQAVDGTIDYTGSVSVPVVGAVQISATLHANLATSVDLAINDPVDEFRVRFAVTSLNIESLTFSQGSTSSPTLVNDLAQATINTLLMPAQALLSRIELRVPTTVSGSVKLKVPPSQGLTVAFEPNQLQVALQASGITHLIDNGRLTIAAQVEGTANNVPKPTNVPYNTFKDDFQKLMATSPTWINQGQISAYVDRKFLQSLVSKTLGAGPICLQANMDKAAPVHTKLKLPPLESIDCSPTTDCTPKDDCTPKGDCAQHADCSACLLRAPEWCAFGGCTGGQCVKSGNDPICEARKVANKGTCEQKKSFEKGTCEATKSAKKAKCEADKTTEKTACEGMKETYKRFRATGADYANIDSDDLRLTGNGKLCLNQVSFDPETLSLTGQLDVAVSARADGHIKFTPLNVAGHLTCFAPFTETLGLNAQVPPQALGINTSAKFIDDSTQVSIEARISNPIHVQFPVSALATQLATDPKFTIFCPIPGSAMKLRATTPDNWWPREARGDISRDLPDLRFDVNLVERPVKAGDMELIGKLRSNKTGIGGVFTLRPGPKAADTSRPNGGRRAALTRDLRG